MQKQTSSSFDIRASGAEGPNVPDRDAMAQGEVHDIGRSGLPLHLTEAPRYYPEAWQKITLIQRQPFR